MKLDFFELSIIIFIIIVRLIRIYYSKKFDLSQSNYSEYLTNNIGGWLKATTFVLFFMPIIIILIEGDTEFVVGFSNQTRYIGVVGLVLTILLKIHVFRKLGKNFIPQVLDRKLVTSGIYRFVRHPMYLTFLLHVFFIFVVMDYMIMFYGVMIVLYTITKRIPVEEGVLSKEFEEYELYVKKTTKLIPLVY